MDSCDELLIVAIARRQRKKRRQRRYWVHPLNTLRDTLGEQVKINEMYEKYPDKFFQYTRMTPAIFNTLFGLIKQYITKLDTNYRFAVPARTRLYVTLRYLATGDSLSTISTSFSIGRSTVWTIVSETLTAIWDVLSPTYLKVKECTRRKKRGATLVNFIIKFQFPSKPEWEAIVDDFESQWQFPNCFGAIDGKHVVITAPPNSGSLFHNYKGTFSVVLLATCDADYNFTVVDVGSYGRQSDGGIFGNSAFGRGLLDGSLDIPVDRRIKGTNIKQPCTLVGDDAFGLSTFMMRPFPEKKVEPKRRIFNYRLSRARRIIENCFGILGSRFRIYYRRLLTDVSQANKIIKGTVVLHNFIRKEEGKLDPSKRLYCPPGYTDSEDTDDGAWRNEVGHGGAFERFNHGGSNNYTTHAKEMRENLANYFLSVEGSVPWQNERAVVSQC